MLTDREMNFVDGLMRDATRSPQGENLVDGLLEIARAINRHAEAVEAVASELGALPESLAAIASEVSQIP